MVWNLLQLLRRCLWTVIWGWKDGHAMEWIAKPEGRWGTKCTARSRSTQRLPSPTSGFSTTWSWSFDSLGPCTRTLTSSAQRGSTLSPPRPNRRRWGRGRTSYSSKPTTGGLGFQKQCGRLRTTSRTASSSRTLFGFVESPKCQTLKKKGQGQK